MTVKTSHCIDLINKHDWWFVLVMCGKCWPFLLLWDQYSLFVSLELNYELVIINALLVWWMVIIARGGDSGLQYDFSSEPSTTSYVTLHFLPLLINDWNCPIHKKWCSSAWRWCIMKGGLSMEADVSFLSLFFFFFKFMDSLLSGPVISGMQSTSETWMDIAHTKTHWKCSSC